jgi:hypothetical protein
MTSSHPAQLPGSRRCSSGPPAVLGSGQLGNSAPGRAPGWPPARLHRLGPRGEPMLAQAASPKVLDAAVGGVEPEPLGDLGRCAALGMGDGVRHGGLLSCRRRESLKATPLLARMSAAGAGKQCRGARDLRVMRHRVAARTASGPWSPTCSSGPRRQDVEPRTIALKSSSTSQRRCWSAAVVGCPRRPAELELASAHRCSVCPSIGRTPLSYDPHLAKPGILGGATVWAGTGTSARWRWPRAPA